MKNENGKFKDMSGKEFGLIKVKSFSHKNKYGHIMWNCVCQCGTEKVIRGGDLKKVKSCGCLRKEKIIFMNKNILSKHKLSNHPAYKLYCDQIKRTTNSKTKSFKRYGGRGIKVEYSLEEFCKWYDTNKRPSKKHSIDRINNDGNYSLDNIRWADDSTQIRNSTTCKSKEYYSTTPITKGNFKKICNCRGWNFKTFIAIPLEEKTSYSKKFYYKEVKNEE